MKKTYLGELEELILLTITLLDDNAYGLAIRNSIKENTERAITIGAIHGTVNRLESKGFITSKLGGATSERGGRRKRLFTITPAGIKMLKSCQEIKVNLWLKIPQLALDNLRKS